MQKLLRNSLMLMLSLNLSGVLPVVSSLIRDAAADGTPSFNMRATGTQAQQIEEQLKLMVRRARHPGTPGTPEGIPSQGDVDQIESAINEWKAGIEHALALPDAPPAGSSTADYLPSDAKLRAINMYFNQLSLLAILRIALGLEHGPAWSDRFALRIPKAEMSGFPGLGAPATNRLGERFLPLIIDRGSDGQADPVSLKISETLMQGLEIGRLADDPSSANFFTMVQYLAVRQLLQNLADLRYLKQDHDVTMPEIPQQLRSKLETMGFSSMIDDEQRRAIAEPGARQALVARYSAVADQVPAFVTDALVDQIAGVIAARRSERRQVAAPLKAALQEAEHDSISAALEQEIASSSLPLSSMQAEEMLPTLRYFVANAKANTLLDKFLHMMADGVLDLRPEQRSQIMAQLEARKAAFSASVTEDALRAWHSSARQAGENALFNDRRSQFIEDLMVHAPEVSHQVQASYAGQTIDPSVLARSLARDIERMNPRESVRDWLYDIVRDDTYAAARDRYGQKMQSLTSPRVLVNGVTDPARAQLYVDSHDFRPDIHFSSEVPAALAQRLIDRVTEGRKADIRNFLTIGGWMGFNNIYAQSAPGVADILTDEGQRGRYFDALNNEVLSRYPILATEVSVTTSDGGQSGDRLYDALTALNPNFQSSPDLIDRAQIYVDQALISTESKIREDIDKVATASELRDIERVVQGSMMLTLVMRGFPEFRLSQERFVEDLLEPSLTSQVMRRYVGNAVTWGCAAMMLLHFGPRIFKRVGPVGEILGALGEALGPVLAGASRAMLVLMLADTAYQAHELYEVSERRQQTEDFFFGSAAGHSFFEYSDMQAANSSYQISKWMFIGFQALNYLPMGYAAIKGVVTARGIRIAFEEFMGDVEAKRLLGLEPVDWDPAHLDDAIARVRANAGAMAPDDLAAAERAYVRLSDKIRSGDTWDLNAIRSGQEMTSNERRLRQALQRAGVIPRDPPANGAHSAPAAGSPGTGASAGGTHS